MSALSTVARLVIAAILLGLMARALFGAPPRSSDPIVIRLLVCTGVLCDTAAIVLSTRGRQDSAGAVAGLSVLFMSLATWLARAPRPDDGDDDGGASDPRMPPDPFMPDGDDDGGGGGGDGPDWDAFDRERAGWGRPVLPA